jgi:hypothetical protein
MSPVLRDKALANRPSEGIVGRKAEIELLLNSLRGTEQSIWYVHGIAGIGLGVKFRMACVSDSIPT